MRIVWRCEMYRYTTRLKTVFIMNEERRRFPVGITATKSAVKIRVRDVFVCDYIIEDVFGSIIKCLIHLLCSRIKPL